jgi:hypothetical protein
MLYLRLHSIAVPVVHRILLAAYVELTGGSPSHGGLYVLACQISVDTSRTTVPAFCPNSICVRGFSELTYLLGPSHD